VGKIRCTSGEEKALKKASILRETRRYFPVQSFFEITMNQIAEGLGLAKGTIYLYFPTKEDLFLELLIEDMRTWFKLVISRIYFFELTGENALWRIRINLNDPVQAEAKAFLQESLDRNRKINIDIIKQASENITQAFLTSTETVSMLELLSLFKSVLAEKASPDCLKKIRNEIQIEMNQLAEVLAQTGYFSRETFANRFTYQAFAGMVGLFQLSPPRQQDENKVEMTQAKLEFFYSLRTFLNSLYQGCVQNASGIPSKTPTFFNAPSATRDRTPELI